MTELICSCGTPSHEASGCKIASHGEEGSIGPVDEMELGPSMRARGARASDDARRVVGEQVEAAVAHVELEGRRRQDRRGRRLSGTHRIQDGGDGARHDA